MNRIILPRRKKWRKWKHWDNGKKKSNKLICMLVIILTAELGYGGYLYQSHFISLVNQEYIRIFNPINGYPGLNQKQSGIRVKLREGYIEFYRQQELEIVDN